MDSLQDKIMQIVVLEKRYRDQHYSARQLAIDLGTTSRCISAVINNRFHMNYTSFVNKYRIDEARSILKDRRYNDLNLKEIAMKVGFSTCQSFYNAFNKIQGITPRAYRLMYSDGLSRKRHN